MKKKEVMLIVCKCGRIKKYQEWVFISNSFSSFIRLAIRQNISGFEFPLGECNYCQAKKMAFVHS
jgi:hypothetical protein